MRMRMRMRSHFLNSFVFCALGGYGGRVTGQIHQHQRRTAGPLTPTAPADAAPTSASSLTELTTIWPDFPTFILGQLEELGWKVTKNPGHLQLPDLTLLLVQTNGASMVIDSTNSLLILEKVICDHDQEIDGCSDIESQDDSLQDIQIGLNIANPGASPAGGPQVNLQNFLFCFADISAPNTCLPGSYSPVFNIAPNSAPPAVALASIVPSFTTPTGTLSLATVSLAALSPILTWVDPTATAAALSDLSTVATTAPSSVESALLTSTASGSKSLVTSTTKISSLTAEATLNSAGAASSKSHHGLSIGAIVGIVLGVVIAILLALALALYLFRRRRQAHPRPERMALTSGSPYARDGSRELIMEKGRGAVVDVGGPLMVNSARNRSSMEMTREIPTRTPTGGTSHGMPSPVTSSEPYFDSPPSTSSGAGAVFRDARHTPQIFRGTGHFLAEVGMTREEVERLEDEERRIDAAIAEAESRRRNN